LIAPFRFRTARLISPESKRSFIQEQQIAHTAVADITVKALESSEGENLTADLTSLYRPGMSRCKTISIDPTLQFRLQKGIEKLTAPLKIFLRQLFQASERSNL
jgi:hypothetical protein